jgi:20S proteasome subunit beta 7
MYFVEKIYLFNYLNYLASYGSLARFRNERRMHPVGTHTILGAGGDISDYQYVQHLMDQLMYPSYYFSLW